MNRYLRKTFATLLYFTLPLTLRAQRSEIWREKPGTWLLNVSAGTTYYAGDLSEWANLGHLQLGTALSTALAYRYTRQLTLRGEAQLYYIRGTQQNTHLAYNNLSFYSINPDVWVGVQWDFWKAEDRNHVVIPYVLAGAGVTYLTPKARYRGQTYSLAPLHTENVNYGRLPLIIRYGLGVPVTASERFRLHIEGAYTHVMSDYVDDVSTVYPDIRQMNALRAALTDRRLERGQAPNRVGAQRGNADKRDGYFVLSARLIFVIMTPAQHNYRQLFGR